VKVVITGANSAVGLAILRCGPTLGATTTLVGAVRSDRAADEIRRHLGVVNAAVRISYDDPGSLAAAFHEASAVIHLPGILIERRGSTYEQAHVDTTRGVLTAATRSAVEKFVFVSAIGASESSSNGYWRTKGRAEALVRASGLSYTVLRAPLLLGPETEGASALRRKTSRRMALLIGGGRNRQQPLDVDDLAQAALVAARPAVASNRTLDCVGPVSLMERDIVERAARLVGRHVTVWPVPKRWVSFGIAICRSIGRTGLSQDALEVITADTSLDPQPATKALGIQLTGIDEMICKSLPGASGNHHT
jgi:uncharacterized protein YbjT (DUF2867 family)